MHFIQLGIYLSICHYVCVFVPVAIYYFGFPKFTDTRLFLLPFFVMGYLYSHVSKLNSGKVYKLKF